jgi:hypothetical protein
LFLSNIKQEDINMAEAKKIKVCEKCSGFDVTELKDKVKDHTVGCIGRCAEKHPHLTGKILGILNDTYTVCDTIEEFYGIITELIEA